MKNQSNQQGNKACFNPYYTPDYIVKAIDYLQNNKAMTDELVTQHYKAEWHTDEGVRIVVARVHVGNYRTSAYVPMPPEHWPDGVPGEVYRRVQEMYCEDDAKEF